MVISAGTGPDGFTVERFVSPTTPPVPPGQRRVLWNGGIPFSARSYLDGAAPPQMVQGCRDPGARSRTCSLPGRRLPPSPAASTAVMEHTDKAAVVPVDMAGPTSARLVAGKAGTRTATPAGDGRRGRRNSMSAARPVGGGVGRQHGGEVATDDAVLVAKDTTAVKRSSRMNKAGRAGAPGVVPDRRQGNCFEAHPGQPTSSRCRSGTGPSTGSRKGRHGCSWRHFVHAARERIAVHRLENPGRVPLRMIEVQSGEYVGEDDIVRIEDDYGR